MAELLPKPLYGDPCNGCGLCCIAEQCPISVAIFGAQKICPALEEAGQAMACGLVRNTADYVPDLPSWGGKALSEAFGLLVGAGCGCDGTTSDDSDDRIAAYRPLIRSRAMSAIATASPEARELVSYFQGGA